LLESSFVRVYVVGSAKFSGRKGHTEDFLISPTRRSFFVGRVNWCHTRPADEEDTFIRPRSKAKALITKRGQRKSPTKSPKISPQREGLTLPISSSTPSLPEPLPHVRTVAPFASNKPKHRLSKQLSMRETPRDVAWEKRRRQMLKIQEKKHKGVSDNEYDPTDLTDEDLRELKGSIELGFGFKEEAGLKLCNTLPALDLYFAVNRQLSPLPSPSSSRSSNGGDGSLSSTSTSSSSIPCSPKTDSDSLKILCLGQRKNPTK
ncbi:unnamed protein product, partial [Thlaspi arvense]